VLCTYINVSSLELCLISDLLPHGPFYIKICGPVEERSEGGHNSPGAESLQGAPKSPNNVTSTFFNTVHLLQKDLMFEHGGAKLVSCPGRHLTSLRPWLSALMIMYFCLQT